MSIVNGYFCVNQKACRSASPRRPFVLKHCSIQSNPFVLIIFTNIDRFLADRTNGRAYATVLCLSVRPSARLWRYVLWLNGAS